MQNDLRLTCNWGMTCAQARGRVLGDSADTLCPAAGPRPTGGGGGAAFPPRCFSWIISFVRKKSRKSELVPFFSAKCFRSLWFPFSASPVLDESSHSHGTPSRTPQSSQSQLGHGQLCACRYRLPQGGGRELLFSGCDNTHNPAASGSPGCRGHSQRWVAPADANVRRSSPATRAGRA